LIIVQEHVFITFYFIKASETANTWDHGGARTVMKTRSFPLPVYDICALPALIFEKQLVTNTKDHWGSV
jgi:hypothetical protein